MRHKIFSRFKCIGVGCFALLCCTLYAASMHDMGYDGFGYKSSEIGMGYATSARSKPIGLLDWNCGFSGAFLWWDVSQENMEVFSSPSGANVYHQKFVFTPGFTIALWGDFVYDDWRGTLEWTRVRSRSTTTSAASTNVVLFPGVSARGDITPSNISSQAGISAINTFTDVSSLWIVDFNTLNCLMSRPFYVSSHFTMASFMGIKFAWFRQRWTITRTLDGIPRSNRLKSNAWAAGPHMACRCMWMMPFDVGVETYAGGSVIYQSTRVRNVYDELRLTAISDTISDLESRPIPRALKPHMVLGLALTWGTYVNDGAWNLNCKIGYEFNQYWYQNEIQREAMQNNQTTRTPLVTDDTTPVVSNQANDRAISFTNAGNLSFHGIVAEVKFDF